jgi:molecular chaperone IbpA
MGINTAGDAEVTGRIQNLACKKENTMTGVQQLFPRGSFIGFDHLFNELDHVAKHANDHYPPHNIIKTGETDYLIELAVAGFPKDALSIEVKDRTLTVIGEFDTNKREYIHRGISTKKFKRTFRLSEHVQVHGADLKDGILSVELKYVIPEELRPRKIEIGHSEETHDTLHSNTKQLLTESDS